MNNMMQSSKKAVFDSKELVSRKIPVSLSNWISQHEQTANELFHHLVFDQLTGLPNRKVFIHLLEERIAYGQHSSNHDFAVIVLDVDRFKFINDSLGYEVGDHLLSEISLRLSSCIRDDDIVSRLGSDEFGILLNNVSGLDNAISIAERLIKILEDPLLLNNNHTIFSHSSIGIAVGASFYNNAEEILRHADTAMHHAKQNGSLPYQVFDQQMHIKSLKILQLESDLRLAVNSGRLELNYQPIVSLVSSKVIGFEVLIRWNHNKLGPLSPNEFIPIAEKCGLIIPLGEWVLEESCLQFSKIQQEFPCCEELFFSINISGQQICEKKFPKTIKDILRKNNISPKCIKIEITETSLLECHELLLSNIREIKRQGIGVSMDDFGTGYSSLSYLCKFDFDLLKIDKSFIQSDKSEKIEIIHAIIVLAHSLGMDVIAEGIESQEQLNELLSLGCKFGQGFLFSKPVCIKKLKDIITQQDILPSKQLKDPDQDKGKLLGWSKSQLVTHISCLQKEVKKLGQENRDLEVLLQTTAEHADWLEIELQDQIKQYQKTELELQQANRVLSSLAEIDELTQVANRRRLDSYLEEVWEELAEENQQLTLILLDIDYFKQFNDTYGHQNGDICLKKVAQAIKFALHKQAPKGALLARYGGEEFAIILPRTNTQEAFLLANDIKVHISDLSIPHENSSISNCITVSQGIASVVPTTNSSPTNIFGTADQALYEAKSLGRNRYHCKLRKTEQSDYGLDRTFPHSSNEEMCIA